MVNNNYIFQKKYKMLLTILAVLLLVFIDKIVPPYGIPIALILIIVLFKLQKQPIKGLGLYKPDKWLKVIIIGFATAVFIQIIGIYIFPSFFEWLKLPDADFSTYKEIEGNNSMLIIYMIVSWTTAGFGEELIFRGFLMKQITAFFDKSKFKWIFSLIITSVIFGLIHYNNGLEAIILTTFSGLVLGLVYLKTNHNIWASYFAHAITDTIAFMLIYTGLYNFL
ncbi:lysostaphin resistance A-like protein [Bacteroidota bacterium]